MADAPKRIQRKRTKGWRMPYGAVSVTRPGPFGNQWQCHRPYGCPKSPQYDHGFEPDGKPSMVCCTDVFREWVRQGQAGEESHLIGKGGGFRAAILAQLGNVERTRLVAALPRLRGKTLACWCALCPVHADGRPFQIACPDCQPCHADVLLEIANAPLRCDPA